MTQMRRWGQISDDKSDDWYKDLAKKVYRPDIYEKAVKSLIKEKLANAEDFPDFETEDGFRDPQTHFIDDIVYDGKQPNAYLEKFVIGLKKGDKI
jgi:nitrate/nitrite transport system substrate-binding protein